MAKLEHQKRLLKDVYSVQITPFERAKSAFWGPGQKQGIKNLLICGLTAKIAIRFYKFLEFVADCER